MSDDYNIWLNTLKVGDRVAVQNRRLESFGRHYGYRLYTVTNITPKRGRFDVINPREQAPTPDKILSFNGRGHHSIGSGWNKESFCLESVTPEIIKSIAVDTLRISFQAKISKLEDWAVMLRRDCPRGPTPEIIEDLMPTIITLLAAFEVHFKKETANGS